MEHDEKDISREVKSSEEDSWARILEQRKQAKEKLIKAIMDAPDPDAFMLRVYNGELAAFVRYGDKVEVFRLSTEKLATLEAEVRQVMPGNSTLQ